MPIIFPCACGKTLKVADEHAGKLVRCPACQGVAAVPAVATDLPVAAPPSARPVVATPSEAAPPPPPAKRPKADGDEYGLLDDEAPRRKADRFEDDRPSRRRSRNRDDDDDDDRPRKRTRRRTSSSAGFVAKRVAIVIGGILFAIAGAIVLIGVWTGNAARTRGPTAVGLALLCGGIGGIANGATGNISGGRPGDDDD